MTQEVKEAAERIRKSIDGRPQTAGLVKDVYQMPLVELTAADIVAVCDAAKADEIVAALRQGSVVPGPPTRAIQVNHAAHLLRQLEVAE